MLHTSPCVKGNLGRHGWWGSYWEKRETTEEGGLQGVPGQEVTDGINITNGALNTLTNMIQWKPVHSTPRRRRPSPVSCAAAPPERARPSRRRMLGELLSVEIQASLDFAVILFERNTVNSSIKFPNRLEHFLREAWRSMARHLIRDEEEVHINGWRNGLIFQSAARRTSAEQYYAGICEVDGWLSLITHLRHTLPKVPSNGPDQPQQPGAGPSSS